jgi:geranylgeranyl reductase family protein
MTTVEVCVIGAGPSGCTAARLLAEAGRQVLVLEEHGEIGTPVDCSGVVGVEAFDRLGLPKDSVRSRFDRFEVISPSGRSLSFAPHRILAYIVDRAAFDQGLATRAEASGAVIWTHTCVRALAPAANRVRLTVRRAGADADILAQSVILAGGPRYQFQQQLGMGQPARYLRTVQAEVEQRQGGTPRIFLGSAIAPGSFAWWLPLEHAGSCRVKMGVSSTGRSGAPFAAFLHRLRRDRLLVSEDEIRPRQWMIPISPIHRTFSDRVVAVGDAAGQTKPTTGGGLYYGLVCAAVAAEVLEEGFRRGDLSSRFLVQYERRWRQILARELEAAQRFRRFFERLSDADIDHLFDLVSQDGLVRYLEEEADFDWHRRTILQGAFRVRTVATFLAQLRRKQLSGLLS